MGRTVPTYRLHTESILNDWMDYCRALREKDREVFDELMYKARLHASAGSYAAHLDPVATMFLSILLEMQKEIQDIKRGNEADRAVPETKREEGAKA
ncbi:MAG: hypothetical protein A3K65_06450 [Euryarchaeota archaeon RBG_16_68_12]|nr:MAG: hypothetical protein A3K65_06450 [Euryarchaeota archaeon RBG_16_68_12]HLE55392.1 hypothetical protein [Thermoplasmata archaeon]